MGSGTRSGSPWGQMDEFGVFTGTDSGAAGRPKADGPTGSAEPPPHIGRELLGRAVGSPIGGWGRGAAPLQGLTLWVRPPPPDPTASPQAPRTKWRSCCWAASSAASGAWRSSSSSSTGTPTSWYGVAPLSFRANCSFFGVSRWFRRRVSLCPGPRPPPHPPSAPQIAVYGTNFCTSARNAFSLLMRNIIRWVKTPKSQPRGASPTPGGSRPWWGGGGRSPPSGPQGRRVG